MPSNQDRRKLFAQWQTFEEKQQRRELDDLSFYEGEGQWPDDIAKGRKGQDASGGMPAVPARPMITVNKVREPIRHVVNEERASDLGVEIVAADDMGGVNETPISKDEIELREGLVRRIQRESYAIDARIWAAERATIAGRGYYGVMSRYLPGKTNDQELFLRRFYDQGGILLDPAHEEPDGSDAEGAFVPTWIPYEQYKAEYPKRANGKDNSMTQLGESDFKTLSAKMTDWFRAQDGGPWMVRVVEQWTFERTARGLATLSDGRLFWEDELKALGISRDLIEDEREVINKAVKFYLLDGEEHGDTPLSQTDWPGKYIPIIKIVGEEMQPFDPQRRFEGMVRPTRDSQRGFNYMVSKWVEMIGLTPVPPLMMTPQHIEGFSEMYNSMATRNWPYLLYNSFDPLNPGVPLPSPIRPPVATDIQAVAGSVQLFDAAIKSTTAVPDATLGNVDPSVRSGKGIQALALNALKATAHFGDNFQRSVNYEGRILNDLLEPIYGRRHGRTARLFTSAREQKTVQISVPSQMPQQAPPVNAPGQPQMQPAQPQGMPGQPPMAAGVPPPQEPPKVYTLTPGATFNVAVKVTKNYDTLREAEASTVMDAVNAAPEWALPLMGDLVFKYQDGPGHDELAERAVFGLRPELQAKLQGGPSGQVQQLQQQIQQLTQQLQSKVAEKQAEGQLELQKEDMKQKGDTARLQMELQAKERLALVNQLAALAAVDAKVDAENARTEVDAAIARVDKELNIRKQAVDHAQERITQASQQQHEGTTLALEHAHEANLAQLQHEQSLEAQANAPEPTTTGV